VADEIAGPLGADYQIGAAEKDWDRIAPVVPPPPLPFDLAAMDPQSPLVRCFTGPVASAAAANTPEWRRADMGALNGHTNARGLLTVMRTLTLGGSGPLKLSPSTVDLVFQQQADGVDLVLMAPLKFGIGYGLTPTDAVPYLPAGKVAFWGGWGGSIIVMDLDRRLTISYLMNRMAPGIIGSPRSETYVRAVYDALG
jgi:CubicO group peptidase (beta-lactamase class C family)